MQKATNVDKIEFALDKMEIGDSLNKKEIILSIYQGYDYFKHRSFDVNFTHAKKRLLNKKFKTIEGNIIRVSL